MRDTRGILDPGRMARFVDYQRVAAPAELRPFVDWFWRVSWDLPAGEEFVQAVLTHPSAHLSVGPVSSRGIDDDRIEATVVGVTTSVDRRRLRGRGWNVAAKLAPGALGAFLQQEAASLTQRIEPMSALLPVDATALVDALVARPTPDQQVRVLGDVVGELLAGAPPARLVGAREAIGVAALVESDRSLCSVTALARASGFGVRTLQRLFREYAGVTPLWMIRRYRLIDAAEAARAGSPGSWSDLASELGYTDQAHLIRDFKATVGQTPARYAAAVTPLLR